MSTVERPRTRGFCTIDKMVLLPPLIRRRKPKSEANAPSVAKSGEDSKEAITDSTDGATSPSSIISTPSPSSPVTNSTLETATPTSNIPIHTSETLLSKSGKMYLNFYYNNECHLIRFARQTFIEEIMGAIYTVCEHQLSKKENEDPQLFIIEKEDGKTEYASVYKYLGEVVKNIKKSPSTDASIYIVNSAQLPQDATEIPKDRPKRKLDDAKKKAEEPKKKVDELPRTPEKLAVSSTSLSEQPEQPQKHLNSPSIVLNRNKRRKIDDSPEYSSSSSSSASNSPTPLHLSQTPGVVGLANLKNTCFANSVLQSLSNAGNFRQFLCDLKMPSTIPHELVLYQMVKLLNLMWNGKYELLTPSSLFNSINLKIKYEFGTEEDAHWFLQVLIQTIDEEILNYCDGSKSLQQIFETKRRKEHLCPKCNHVNTSAEFSSLINTLPLSSSEYADKSTCTLEECLDLYSKECSDTPQLFCTKCEPNLEDPPNEKMVITELPPNLCFHFNRGRWTGKVINRATRSGARGKINTRVIFPLQLDMMSSLNSSSSSTTQNASYRLASVVVHDGLTPATGHYYSYCYNSTSRKWYKFDDDRQPIEVLESVVLKANPFMLFYQPS